MELMKTLAILNAVKQSTNETKFEWTVWLNIYQWNGFYINVALDLHSLIRACICWYVGYMLHIFRLLIVWLIVSS